MICKTINYTDFNGNQRTEEFYFNLTDQEITELELTTEGGFRKMIDRIVAAKSQTELVMLFKDLIMKAYGKKGLDGRTFDKSPEVKKEFASTQAFSDIYMELVTNTDKAVEFFNGVVDRPSKPNLEVAKQ